MKQTSRLFLFLLLNILISACTTLVVLSIWDRTHEAFLDNILSQVTRRQPTPTATQETPVATLPAGPTPTPAYMIHQVSVGETFESIAAFYGVTVDELLRENGFNQVQGLSVEDTLRIPVRIVTIESVVGVGDLSLERVVVRSLIDSELSLFGWKIEDESGKQYIFPDVRLIAKESGVSVNTRSGTNSVNNLFWGLSEAAWERNEKVRLLDSTGRLQAEYLIP